ncbi:hypothetical protein RM697_01345 [Ichthyenterobacterium sp. W332]|uniref:Uncharacterized protein n=1 Tax=Microcosmobacter mediterraneus TaxID=3075607 RepID=A0ABU2YGG6_9FLAO|nr:hypothetical protein [Ichthyenterobacterium sp. W332]MDT0557271.1 hypothetical protein [Ichthyenterobacterium sp. W332]
MRLILLSLILFSSNYGIISAQEANEITSIDYVKILNDNTEEALYYYENNWKQLRIKALEKGYIKSYKLLKVINTNAEFNLILQTTYTNKFQFEKREARFQELIKAHGALKLLNEKESKDFRKTVFWSDTKQL